MLQIIFDFNIRLWSYTLTARGIQIHLWKKSSFHSIYSIPFHCHPTTMGTSTTIITEFFVTHKYRSTELNPQPAPTKYTTIIHSSTKNSTLYTVLHYQHHLPNGIMKKNNWKQIILSSSINLCQPDSFNCMCECMSLVYKERVGGYCITSQTHHHQ